MGADTFETATRLLAIDQCNPALNISREVIGWITISDIDNHNVRVQQPCRRVILAANSPVALTEQCTPALRHHYIKNGYFTLRSAWIRP